MSSNRAKLFSVASVKSYSNSSAQLSALGSFERPENKYKNTKIAESDAKQLLGEEEVMLLFKSNLVD